MENLFLQMQMMDWQTQSHRKEGKQTEKSKSPQKSRGTMEKLKQWELNMSNTPWRPETKGKIETKHTEEAGQTHEDRWRP